MNRLESFLGTKGNGAFYIGHASLLARFGERLVMFDPVWNHKPYGADWTFVPPQVNCDPITDRVDHVIVSHIHEDHLCESVLSQLDNVWIMQGRPELEWRMQESIDFTALPPHRWCALEAGLEVYFVPNPVNGVDSSCFVRGDGYCVYHGNDNFLSDEQLVRIAQDVGPVDVACVPYAFVHWYPHLMISLSVAERTAEMKRLRQQSIDCGARLIDFIKPTIAIPFGNSLFYARGASHCLNRYLARPWDLPGGTPLMAGDYVLGSQVSRELRDPPEHDELLTHYLGARMDTTLDLDFKATDQALRRIQNRIQGLPRIKDHQFAVNNIVIDLGTLNVRRGDPVPPYHRFRLDRSVYDKWLNREMTFEQALGTRRFLASRQPNVYRQDVFEWMQRYL